MLIGGGCAATGPGTETVPLSTADAAAGSARGGEVLQPFKTRSMVPLEAGLAAGPDQAVDACRVKPLLAEFVAAPAQAATRAVALPGVVAPRGSRCPG